MAWRPSSNTPLPGKHKHKGKKRLDAWYYENPDNLETMIKDGVTLYWCSFHKCWGNHKTVKCYKKQAHDQRIAEEKAKSTHSKSKHKDKKGSSKTLTLARALVAMTDGADGEASFSEDEAT